MLGYPQPDSNVAIPSYDPEEGHSERTEYMEGDIYMATGKSRTGGTPPVGEPSDETDPARDRAYEDETDFTDFAPHAVQKKPGTPELGTQPLKQLIDMRDRFLVECFDIESGRRFVIDAQDADERLALLRRRVEEIHEELARRDLSKRSAPPASVPQPSARQAQTQQGRELSGDTCPLPSTGDRALLQDYLTRSEQRISMLDDLARAARDQGDIVLALNCTTQAQAIDRERMDCLSQWQPLGTETEQQRY